MSSIILHIDMNSYFASVEQQANPFLRGRPLGICAYMGKNGAIIASSVEAKKYGIRVSRAREARKICPEIILVQNDPAKYRSTTRRIFAILAEYTERLEPYSIDEAFLDLTGYAKTYDEAFAIGVEIKRRIKEEVGEYLRSSVGIAPTRFLAKCKSDNQATDGIGVLSLEGIPEFLEPLKLTDICGINVRIESRLLGLGIRTPNELCQAAPANMLSSLGKFGYYLWANLNGDAIDRVTLPEERPPKSIGHSYMLPKKGCDRQWLAGIFLKLCERAGRRLREHDFEARAVSVRMGMEEYDPESRQWSPGSGYHTRVRTRDALYTTAEIFNAGWDLLEPQIPREGEGLRVTFLAMSVGSFRPFSGQQALFENFQEEALYSQSDLLIADTSREVSEALDSINDKYGEFTVRYGAMHGTDKNAPDRVGYRKTVEVERKE